MHKVKIETRDVNRPTPSVKLIMVPFIDTQGRRDALKL